MTPTASERSHQVLHRVDDGSRLLGTIVIDSTIDGRARGGLRMVSDVGEAELRDAARSMTLKYGFLGLPQGGAKAGIRADGEASPADRERALAAFARAAAPLLRARTFVPDPDLGTVATDIRRMMNSIGVAVAPREWRTNRSGEYTAVSCLAAASELLAARGRDLAGCRVAVEGFGGVGSALARFAAAAGARVVAISTSRGALHDPVGLDVESLADRARAVGSRMVEEPGSARRMPRGELLELPVDVLFPCARHHSIDAANVERVAAGMICAGANDPVSPAAERTLIERGVVVPPDFVTNCGGVLGGTLAFAAVPPRRIVPVIERFVRRRTAEMIGRASAAGSTMRAVAEAEALERHAEARRRAEDPGPMERVVSLAIAGYRHGLVPECLVGRLAPRFFGRLAG